MPYTVNLIENFDQKKSDSPQDNINAPIDPSLEDPYNKSLFYEKKIIQEVLKMIEMKDNYTDINIDKLSSDIRFLTNNASLMNENIKHIKTINNIFSFINNVKSLVPYEENQNLYNKSYQNIKNIINTDKINEIVNKSYNMILNNKNPTILIDNYSDNISNKIIKYFDDIILYSSSNEKNLEKILGNIVLLKNNFSKNKLDELIINIVDNQIPQKIVIQLIVFMEVIFYTFTSNINSQNSMLDKIPLIKYIGQLGGKGKDTESLIITPFMKRLHSDLKNSLNIFENIDSDIMNYIKKLNSDRNNKLINLSISEDSENLLKIINDLHRILDNNHTEFVLEEPITEETLTVNELSQENQDSTALYVNEHMNSVKPLCRFTHNTCKGHHGINGESINLLDEDTEWNCNNCDCRDVSDRCQLSLERFDNVEPFSVLSPCVLIPLVLLIIAICIFLYLKKHKN